MNGVGGTATIDLQLTQIIAGRTVDTIQDAISVMRDMDAVLPNEDGLKWFNYLYLSVTASIESQPPVEVWEDPVWLTRLDVVFAGLYFAAVAGWQRDPTSVPGAWVPLFEARRRPGLQRIQFALAGMNAHINRDLVVALVQTGKELGIVPQIGTPQHRDFERVNTILEQVESRIKEEFATGVVAGVVENLGDVADIIAMWNVRAARETAWVNAQVLWNLRGLPFPALADNYIKNLDRLVGFAGRGLLVTVG
jgi:hypothetical protein